MNNDGKVITAGWCCSFQTVEDPNQYDGTCLLVDNNISCINFKYRWTNCKCLTHSVHVLMCVLMMS